MVVVVAAAAAAAVVVVVGFVAVAVVVVVVVLSQIRCGGVVSDRHVTAQMLQCYVNECSLHGAQRDGCPGQGRIFLINWHPKGCPWVQS